MRNVTSRERWTTKTIFLYFSFHFHRACVEIKKGEKTFSMDIPSLIEFEKEGKLKRLDPCLVFHRFSTPQKGIECLRVEKKLRFSSSFNRIQPLLFDFHHICSSKTLWRQTHTVAACSSRTKKNISIWFSSR